MQLISLTIFIYETEMVPQIGCPLTYDLLYQSIICVNHNIKVPNLSNQIQCLSLSLIKCYTTNAIWLDTNSVLDRMKMAADCIV